jgi:hypothetical protein
VVVLRNGCVMIDWGDGIFQDLHSGAFNQNIDLRGSRAISDDELAWLKRASQIEGYDERQVYLATLPERKRKTIE